LQQRRIGDAECGRVRAADAVPYSTAEQRKLRLASLTLICIKYRDRM
jgi:hypothetical protein